jgi:hypothetical protein
MMEGKLTNFSFNSTSKAAGTLHAMSPEMANLYLKHFLKEEIDYQ